MQQVYQLGGYATRAALPAAEWLAENAYVAPGAHRLMTATGLMAGLVGGRYAMNILTAQNDQGNPTQAYEVPLPFRSLHGALQYRRYDDSPSARWHQVAYDVIPIALGGIGAMVGSTRYSRTTRFATSLAKDIAGGEFGIAQACMLSSKVQARAYNRMSPFSFGLGSSSGFAMFPWPFSTATNAVRFQLENGKKPLMWGLRNLTGNRAPRSRDLYSSVMDAVDWVQSNAATFAGTDTRWHSHAPHIEEISRALMQNVPHATPEHLEQTGKWVSEIAQRVDAHAKQLLTQRPGIAPEKLRAMLKDDAACKGMMRELADIDGHYIRLGVLDPAAPEKSGITVGDHGVLTATAKWLGASEQLAEIEKLWHQSVRHRANPDLFPAPTVAKSLMSYNDFTPRVVGYSAAGAGVMAGIGLIGSREPCPTLSADEKKQLRTLPRHEADTRYHQMIDQRGGGLAHAINGKPLQVAEWTASVAAAAPNLHRFMNAACLSAFLYTGAKFSTALAARGLRGEALAESAVWPIFKPIYGKMQYAWKSGMPADRLKWATHQLIPVAVGAAGTYAGSHLYFGHKERTLRAPKTLEDATEAVLLHESESFSKTSAVTSILNTGSGFHLLPFASYGSNLNNRFMMANGQQVCTPLLGKWWSGNASIYPEHVKKLLIRLVDCAVANPSEYPSEFRPIAHAVLGKLYPSLPAEQMQTHINRFLDALYEVRDRFWQEGGIPEDKLSACRKALEASFRGEGLEHTLQTIGLNPLEAELDHNGASGRLAKWLGAAGEVQRDIDTYRSHALRRMSQASARPESAITQAQTDGVLISAALTTQRS